MKELHLFNNNSSCWDIIKTIESFAKTAGGYSWQYSEPAIIVPDRIVAMFGTIDFQPMDDLAGDRQTDWNVIVPVLQRMLPHATKEESAVLLDMMLVTYAANMGVSVPYLAMG